MENKWIFHIDLDAFFAALEEDRNPQYKKLPIVIGKGRRGIVSTCNYNARKYGIKSGMPLFMAKEICSNLIIVEPDISYYVSKSNEFFKILEKISPFVEPRSIDECFIDSSEKIYLKKDAFKLAELISKLIYGLLGVTISIGIGHNRICAKMGSNFNKPNAITYVDEKFWKENIWKLDVNKLQGSGKKTTEYLKTKKINTIGDLASLSEWKLEEMYEDLGVHIYQLNEFAKGISGNTIDKEDYTLKSLGTGRTLQKKKKNYIILKEILSSMCKYIEKRLDNRKAKGNIIRVSIKYPKSNAKSKQMKINKYINTYNEIFGYALKLFNELWNNNKAIKYIGIVIDNLTLDTYILDQPTIFNEFIINSNSKEGRRISEKMFTFSSLLDFEAMDFLNKPSSISYQKRKAKSLNDRVKFKTWDLKETK